MTITDEMNRIWGIDPDEMAQIRLSNVVAEMDRIWSDPGEQMERDAERRENERG